MLRYVEPNRPEPYETGQSKDPVGPQQGGALETDQGLAQTRPRMCLCDVKCEVLTQDFQDIQQGNTSETGGGKLSGELSKRSMRIAPNTGFKQRRHIAHVCNRNHPLLQSHVVSLFNGKTAAELLEDRQQGIDRQKHVPIKSCVCICCMRS